MAISQQMGMKMLAEPEPKRSKTNAATEQTEHRKKQQEPGTHRHPLRGETPPPGAPDPFPGSPPQAEGTPAAPARKGIPRKLEG